MKIIFSPSKGMKYRKFTNLNTEKQMLFPEKTERLVDSLQKLSKSELGIALKIKGSLLDETFIRYNNFYTLPKYKAIELYNGVSFSHLQPEEYSLENIEYLKNHLTIFSALYGILSPETLIHPYRLDMTAKIEDFHLYSYWKSSIEFFFEKDECIINLASSEFSKLLDRKRYHIIDIEFRQSYDGLLKNISTEANKMRGKLLNHLVKNQIVNLELLKSFSLDGYLFCKTLSKDNKLFFVKLK